MNSLKCPLIHLILFHHLFWFSVSSKWKILVHIHLCTIHLFLGFSRHHFPSGYHYVTILGILLCFTLQRWPRHIKLFIPLLLQQCSPHPLCAWLHYYWLFPPCTFQMLFVTIHILLVAVWTLLMFLYRIELSTQKLSYRLLYYF